MLYLEDLLLQGRPPDPDTLDFLPALWLQWIRIAPPPPGQGQSPLWRHFRGCLGPQQDQPVLDVPESPEDQDILGHLAFLRAQ